MALKQSRSYKKRILLCWQISRLRIKDYKIVIMSVLKWSNNTKQKLLPMLSHILLCLLLFATGVAPPLLHAEISITSATTDEFLALDGYGFKYAHLRGVRPILGEVNYLDSSDNAENNSSAGKLQYIDSDPYERWNRGVQKFNDFGDTYFLRPLAVAYVTIVPPLIANRPNDFLENIKTPLYMVHSILQGNLSHTGLHLFRFLVNTIFGLGGLFDVASMGNLPEAPTGFSETFAAWGIPDGHYLLLPGRTPGSVLDNAGGLLDVWSHVVIFSELDHWQTLGFFSLLTVRAEFLSVDHILRSGGDRYSLTRDLYYTLKRSSGIDIGGDEVTTEDLEAVFDDEF